MNNFSEHSAKRDENGSSSSVPPSQENLNNRHDGHSVPNPMGIPNFNLPPDAPVRNYWHVYSDGTRLPQLFRDEHDYIYGVNRIAISAFLTNTEVLVFALMESHVHIVLHGTWDGAVCFVNEMKKAFNRHFPHIIKQNLAVGFRQLTDINDLRNTIVYVYRNPLEITYLNAPWNYEWGVGNIFFNIHCGKALDNAQRIGDLGMRKIRELFLTRAQLPEEWLFEDGRILSQSFVSVRHVEAIFCNSFHMFLAYLRIKKDDRIRITQLCRKTLISNLSFASLTDELNQSCLDLWRKPWKACDFEERLAIVTDKISKGQIAVTSNLAKAMGISIEVLRTILR